MEGFVFLRIWGIIGFFSHWSGGIGRIEIPRFLDSQDLFSVEDLFLRNLGIKEFVLWMDLFFYGFWG